MRVFMLSLATFNRPSPLVARLSLFVVYTSTPTGCYITWAHPTEAVYSPTLIVSIMVWWYFRSVRYMASKKSASACSSTTLFQRVGVRRLVPDPISDRMVPCPQGVLCVLQYPHEHAEWRPGSTELLVVIDNKVGFSNIFSSHPDSLFRSFRWQKTRSVTVQRSRILPNS